MEVSKTIELDVAPSQVWPFVRDFYNFASWQPHIAAVEPTDVAGERIVHMKRGNTVRDRIVELDDDKRLLSYTMVPEEAPPPGVPRIEDMLASLQVSEAPHGASVTYTIRVTIPEAMQEIAQAGISGDIHQSLEGLKAHFKNATAT